MENTDLCRKFHGFFIRLKKRAEKAQTNPAEKEKDKKSGVAKLLTAKNKEDKKGTAKKEENVIFMDFSQN